MYCVPCLFCTCVHMYVWCVVYFVGSPQCIALKFVVARICQSNFLPLRECACAVVGPLPYITRFVTQLPQDRE